jgi:hypothetical protein
MYFTVGGVLGEGTGPTKGVWATLSISGKGRRVCSRAGSASTLTLPFQHEPVASWTAAKLRWRSATTIQTSWLFVLSCPLLNIQDLNIPLPHMQRVADIEKLFLPVQSEFVQGFGSRLSAKAVELLGMDTEDLAQIAAPPKDGAKDVVELRQIHLIGDCDLADHYGTHMTENCS